jgi:hypothetical protein
MRNISNVAVSANNLVNLPVLVNAAAVSTANLENLPALVKGVKDHGPIAQSEYTTYFHRLLRSETKPPIEQVITSGVEALFVEFLNRDDNPRLQYYMQPLLLSIAREYLFLIPIAN